MLGLMLFFFGAVVFISGADIEKIRDFINESDK